MPLHAITVNYGEAGLRERLLTETGRFPGPDRDKIGAAWALIGRTHRRVFKR